MVNVLTLIVKSSRKVKIVAVVVILIVAGLFVIPKFLGAKGQKAQYQTATVDRGSVLSTLSETGNVSSTNQVSVDSPATGIIEEIYVKNGDQVQAGQNLFKVKATSTPQEKASAYASYLAAQNTLNAAQAKLNSLQAALFKANQDFVTDKGIGTPSDQQKADPTYIEENATWLQSEADYKNQQGVIGQAQAALSSASFAYQATQDSVVTAPVDGTVANLSATVGSSVTASGGNAGGSSNSSGTNSSSTTSSSGTSVLILGNFLQLNIKASVNEIDIPKVHEGQKATITMDAFPDKTFVGSVASLDTIGTATSGVVSYNVYITFVSPPPDIKSGMSASVIIQTDRRDDVLKVPTSAVQTTNGESTVRVMKNGKPVDMPVEIGISSDSETEITSGLSEGDTIVTSMVTQTSQGGQQGAASPFSAFGGGGRGFGGGGGGRGGGGGNVIFRGGGR